MEHETGRDPGQKLSADPLERKPYVHPTLRVFGDVADITRSTANTTLTVDGGAMLNRSKTM